MNPLKQLYKQYSDDNPVNAGLKATYAMLEEDSNYSSCVIDFKEEVKYECETAFYAGFKTAIQLLMGGGQV
ncbi:MAG: hypothetical protein K2J36_04190 [Ruminococcus sp.]|nr:hypothetical protein [Ruminococcus sp.]